MPGRPRFQRRVDHAGIDVRLLLGIVAAVREHLALLGIAEIGKAHVVELQIGAARLAERGDGLAVGLAEIAVEIVHVPVDAGIDHLPPAAIMQHRRRGDGHLRRPRDIGFEEAEVVEHRMRSGKTDLAENARRLGLGLHAGKLDAVIDVDEFDAVELRQEIIVPPRAAELAVGYPL